MKRNLPEIILVLINLALLGLTWYALYSVFE